MARDNFRKLTINRLKERVANRCSNPDCRVPTSAPADGDSVNNIGIAAHITAAAPGGPRYDPKLTEDQRASIQNAIWLCSNCSIDIDRDPERFPVYQLQKWKKAAEHFAREELGNKLPSNNETIDTLTTALTGFPKQYIANAISNVHQASGKALETLDPRFSVETSHSKGKTFVAIHAKEDVSILMKVKNEHFDEYLEKYQQFLEHGKDIQINSSAITFEGSKLIEELFKKDKGLVSLTPKRIHATQKLWLVEDNTNLIESFDDIHGAISIGTKTFTFNGSACNSLFNLTLNKSLDESDNKGSISFSACLENWEGTNLIFLPYLDKLLSLFSKMAEGWTLFTSLEFEGITILTSSGENTQEWDYVTSINNFLYYTKRCQIVCNALNLDIKYTTDVSYSSKEHEQLAEAVRIIEGKETYNEENIENKISCMLTVNDKCENINILTNSNDPSNLIFIQDYKEKIMIFGTEIELPPRKVMINSVIPKIQEDVGRLKPGDTVKVTWMPHKNFNIIISYEI